MATRALKPKREDTILTGWQSIPEKAPSVMREDQPTVARVLAMIGVMLAAVGMLAMLAPAAGWNYVVGPGWGVFFLSIGLVLIVYHAFVDKDVQFRHMYRYAGLFLIVLAVSFRIFSGDRLSGLFVPYGIYALALGMLFLLAVVRNAVHARVHMVLLLILGGLGAVMILAGLFVGQFSADFLAAEGVLLLILGLLYVGAFIGMQDSGSAAGYQAGLALGVAGLVSLCVVLARVFWPVMFGGGESSNSFLVPSGVILLGASTVYVAVALAVCSDWPLVVLVRRELAAFFYSPMAYLVLVAMMLVAWINFIFFIDILGVGLIDPRYLVFEPIVKNYIITLIPVIAQMFVVPILTMRLLSEEKRAGTLEMLLTVPVNEVTITLSKFLAAWLFYLVTWLPSFLFLVAMRSMGGGEFDYRPMLSFSFAVMATGAGFIAMGLFFSSITRNQIIAAVFTFVGMTMHLAAYFLTRPDQELDASLWGSIANYVSFVSLWMRSLDGVLAPRYLVFHVSAAIFFLFLTNKVLESRKWS